MTLSLLCDFVLNDFVFALTIKTSHARSLTPHDHGKRGALPPSLLNQSEHAQRCIFFHFVLIVHKNQGLKMFCKYLQNIFSPWFL